MKAYFEQPKNKNILLLKEEPVPQIGPEEVLIEIHAAGVNRADLLQRRGLYPPPHGAPSILGLECAGAIVKTGAAVTRWKPGDRVCALLTGGGYAEFVAVPHQLLIPIPSGWSYTDAAAFPEAFYTAYYNLFMIGDLTTEQSVLIHAGGSGVGTAAIQLAHARKHLVITTTGSEEKGNACLRLGADHAINYKTENFEERVLTITHGEGVQLILDVIGAKYFESNLRCMARKGTLAVVGLMGGHQSSIDLNFLLSRNLSIRSSTLRNQPLEIKAAITSRILNEVWPLVESGKIKPVVDSVFSFNDVEEAHQRMRENKNFGKIVLEWR